MWSEWLDAIALAVKQLRVQPLKSCCCLAGVTVGVAFLIGVVAVVSGMRRYVERDVAGAFLGVNAFTLQRSPATGDDPSAAAGRAVARRPAITAADADAVREALPEGATLAVLEARPVALRTRYVAGGPSIVAQSITSGLFAIKDLRVTRGRTFTDSEQRLGVSVAVIGHDVAVYYFPGVDPLGRDVVVDRRPFRVVGVLESQGSVFGASLDRQMYVPFRSPLRHPAGPETAVTALVVQGLSPADRVALEEVVREVMRRRHLLRPTQADDFTLTQSTAALDQWQAVEPYLTLGAVLLPAVGLVVGAIVIANILLVAVRERTREIGVRRALGARRRDVRRHFLAEATVLSTVGAGLGVALGAVFARVVAAATPLPTAVAPWSVVTSLALGVGIGITAGAYPASRAARLAPVDALRAE